MESTEITNENVSMEESSVPQQPIQIPAELNRQQALQVLVDAARIAQSKGIFTLDDAELVNKAVRAFTPKTPAGPIATNS